MAVAASTSSSSIASGSSQQQQQQSRTPLQKINKLLSHTFKRTPTSSPAGSIKRASSRSSFYCSESATPSSTSLSSQLSTSSTGPSYLANQQDGDGQDDSDLDIPLPADLFEEYRNKQKNVVSPYTNKAAVRSAASLASQEDYTQRPAAAAAIQSTTRDNSTASSSSLSRAASSPPRLASSTSRARTAANGSAASSSGGSAGLDSSGDGGATRKSAFLSKSALDRGSLGKSWGRAFGRSTAESMRSASADRELEVSAKEDGGEFGMLGSSNDTHKSPPTSLASSMSARPPVSRLTSRDRLTASQPASSSAEHASTAITPALSRPGLSSSTATAGSKAANWLARSGAASGPDGGGVRKGARRAQRAPPTQPPIHDAVLPGMEDGGEGVESGADKREDISPLSAGASIRRPHTSPNMHGRSRSELPPSSPRLDGAEPAARTAATVTISSAAYVRRQQMLGESQSSRTSPSDTGLGTSVSTGAGRGNLFNSVSRMTVAQAQASNGIQSSAALRQRMLHASTSASASSSFTGEPTATPSPPSLLASIPQGHRLPSSASSASGSDVSPPSAVQYALASSAAASGSERGSGSAGSGRAATLEVRRKEAMQEAASRLAHVGTVEDGHGGRREREKESDREEAEKSPRLVPYAARRRGSVIQSASGLHGDGSTTLRRSASVTRGQGHDEPTVVAATAATAPPRPETSMGLYRDPTPLASSSHSAIAEPPYPSHLPPRAASALASYGDENAYREPVGSASRPSNTVLPPSTRTPLAETYRQPLAPTQPALQPLHKGGYSKEQRYANGDGQYQPPAPQQYRQPSPPQHVHQQPPNGYHDLHQHQQQMSMATATPSMTQQAHYSHQVADQRYHQQPYQQQQNGQPVYAQQPQQQQQTPMVEYQVPIQKPVKKGPAVIVVNGKAYARAGILGKGGSSRVYRVLDEKNNLFAIKKVDISRNDHESRASFINEINLLEKLRGNAQIIRLVDSEINEQRKVLLMVMEVGETDLNNLLIEHMGKAISMNFIRYIWEQMLEAVQVIHDENVVHTDLKPANFVLVKGRLKLIDFGISKAIANDTTNIGRDQQIGTANYMPPEALIDSGLGRDGKRLMKLGRAADVWSLGCILYQMVYGRTPFSHLRDISHKIMAIQNPRHSIAYPDFSCPVDERGEEKKGMEVHVAEEVKDTMRSCLKFYQKERQTIPDLLVAPFLRGEGRREVEVAVPKKSDLPTIDDDVMNALVQRVTRMVVGKQLDAHEGRKLAGKLMNELRQTQASS